MELINQILENIVYYINNPWEYVVVLLKNPFVIFALGYGILNYIIMECLFIKEND